jgi:ATP-dependent DNA helicase RecQ
VGAYAWSRPANVACLEPSLTFSAGQHLEIAPEKDLLESFARDLFRKAELREGQYEILSKILVGKDVVGLLPTGGGKSLTYQLASMLLPGATIYVAPLKSLLQDQYERLKLEGIDACGFISSALNTQERRVQEERFSAGRMRMLQVAPERFLMQNFRRLLNDYQSRFGSICQVVVDECHCVSEWGHDFRPAYLSLSRIIKNRTSRLGSAAPVVALTGTASSIVLDDVRRELGIQDSASVVRSKRMDRPELELTFELTPTSKKRQALVEHTAEFLARHGGTRGGLLVFTQHVNGSFGVYDLGCEIVNRLNLEFGRDVRLYSGEAPKAISASLSSAEWDREKAQAQRAFISPKGDSFQILVATSAFGMGIDKPSIREVIHYLAPQSPESYYQEVGRAARDREPARAVLLFSDEASGLTDQILSPETSIADARQTHAALKRGKPVGDFLTTFFFHASRFTGVENEVSFAVAAVNAIKQLVDAGSSIVLSYIPNRTANGWNTQGSLEYSLVRLIHLGVVLDYTKDFNANTIEVSVSPLWLDARKNLAACRENFIDSFEAYVRQYETRPTSALVDTMRAAGTVLEVEKAAVTAIVEYLYSQIERRRRTSTRTMLELARAGVTDVAEARKRLLFYLQASEKFTHELEELARADQRSLMWSQIAKDAESPVEVDELRGAVTRVLESYPTHPGLLLLSAIVRRAPSLSDLERSKEEFQAALKLLVGIDSPDAAADAAEEALNRCTNIDASLSGHLRTAYGAWSYVHYGPRFALEHTGADRIARMSVFNEMLAAARAGLPASRI